jgi:DNA-binding Xre family transcriptional regulator
MKNKENKLDTLIKNASKSNWKEKVEYLIDNEAWLDKSADIALSILDRLDDLKISKAELARRMGVSRQYVNKIVKGQENLTLEQISKIEQALEFKLVDIVDYQQEEVNTIKVSTEMEQLIVQVFESVLSKLSIEELFKSSYKSSTQPKKVKSVPKNKVEKVSAEGETNYAMAA